MGLPYGFIKLRKRSIFVIDSYLNGSVFTALKGPVIIYHLGRGGEGGSEDFWGDHLIFRRTEGGISRN